MPLWVRPEDNSESLPPPPPTSWEETTILAAGLAPENDDQLVWALIAANPSPSDQQILDGMQDNICRCGCYQRIVAAVRQAATGA